MAHAAIAIEGGLFASDLLDRIAATPDDVPGQKPTDFGIDGTRLSDEIQTAFSDTQLQWESFKRRRARSHESLTTLTRESWVIPLLEILGYELAYQRQAAVVDGATFAISHRPGADPGAPPVHIVAADQRLDSRGEDGRRSPHALVQEYLNRTDPLWGIVTNGMRLRLLRDTARLARPTYVEFDLEAMFEENLYSEFVVFWRLCHRSRLPQGADDAHDCLFERYHQQGIDEGGRVRERLRDGIEEALKILGTGFLQHEDSDRLRDALAAGRIDELGYYCQLLRLIYRLLFLMVAEERRLLLLSDHENRARQEVYTKWYSAARLRDRAEQRTLDDPHGDLWESLKRTFRMFRTEDEATQLGLTALNGELFGIDACFDLEQAGIRNDLLLQALFNLSTFREREGRRGRSRGVRRRVNYAALDVEELGSVYESLLDFHPHVSVEEHKFDLAAGSERKTTGSYYTPPVLVRELIKSALEPVLEERLAAADTREAKVAAILDLKVCDPAAGSGHFLLAAARRLGRELAIVRSGEAEPTPTDYRAAVRDVIRHCIYAVDVNPLAVDLCKVALWIEGHAAGYPLSFLDHHVKRGNSLIGVYDLEVLETGIPDGAYKALIGDDRPTATGLRARNRQERSGQRTMDTEFGDAPAAATDVLAKAAAEIDKIEEVSPDDVQQKEERYAALHDSGTEWHRLKTACDIWCAAFFAQKRPVAGAGQEVVPTTEFVRRARAGAAPPARMGAMADALANEHGFFHWPLEFPEAIAAGGFDVMLGNPPWDVSQFSEKEFFAVHAPEIAEQSGARRKAEIRLLEQERPEVWDAYSKAKRQYDTVNEFFRSSNRFKLSTRGKLNSYALFAEAYAQFVGSAGRAGFMVPSGIATDDSNKEFFDEVVTSGKLASLFSFENEEFIFRAVHHAFRFCLLTIHGLTSRADGAEIKFVYFARQPGHLNDERRVFTLSPEDIELINPNTRTCPIFRSQADAELAKKVYGLVPIFIDEARCDEGNPWGATFRQGLFNMTSDSGLFRTYQHLKEAGATRERVNWRGSDGEVWVPLYEAKMIHQYDHRWATYEEDGKTSRDVSVEEKLDDDFVSIPRYWVPEQEVVARVRDRAEARQWLLGWRDITGVEKIRTVIADALPIAGIGHSLPLAFLTVNDFRYWAAFLGGMNSLVYDFLARQKVGGTHLTYGYLKQLPTLPPTSYDDDALEFITLRVLELIYTAKDMKPFAEDMGYEGPPFPWDSHRRALLRAELDAYYAYLYGLTRDELRYILDPADVMGPDYPSETFRVLKNNEIRECGEYRTQRLVLEAWGRFASDGTFDPARMGTESSIDIPTAGNGEVRRRLAAAEVTIAALQAAIGDSKAPTLFVEGETDVRILEAAWSVFYPDELLPVRVRAAGGTTQMHSLAAKGKALRELLEDRVVCALADNDGDGRALWNDGNLHKGGVWKEQTNGINWCLLRPTDEFVDIMLAHNIPKSCWPFTIESCFSAALRADALADGAYGFAPGAQSDLTTNPEVAQRMLQVLPGLADTDPASFYLRPPATDLKNAFADWVTARARRTHENFAAFEVVLDRLRALLSNASNGSG